MTNPSNWSCLTCGSSDLTDGFDGFFYCLQCGSQADDFIDTGVADEDLVIREAGAPGGPIYSQSHTRRRIHTVKVEPISQSQSQFDSVQSQFWRNLELEEGENGVGPTEPEDFGSNTDEVIGAPGFEEYADEVRMRYVMGLQLMIELQCEVLVKEFNVSSVICGLAATIWLRFVTATRVFDGDWAFEMIQDSENLHQDLEKPRPISSRHRAEPHNLYGQRAVVIWLGSLRQKIPLSCSLAVSFLACHVAREAILPTDIMKWSLEGKLPYFAAFIDIEKRIGQTSRACPISSQHMYRPSRITPLQKLESLAASIAHTIGLNLPPVNFHVIACRYLNKLSLPAEKIFPHACRIYEWSMPPNLWLSTNELRLPSRVCVMSILIISIRILYSLHGFGEWEKSLSVNCASSFSPNQKRYPSAARNSSSKQADSESGSGFTSPNLDNLSNCGRDSSYKPELTAAELLHKIEARYHEIAENHEYSKDLPTYLQHCKDVVFAGSESLFEDHEEEKMIEQFWNYYQTEKDSGLAEDAVNVTSNQKRLREVSDDRLSNESKKSRGEDCVSNASVDNKTPEPNNSQQSRSSESSQDDEEEEPSPKDDASTKTFKDEAIRRMKLDMEEKRFYYIPPRVNPKRFDYLHYGRKIDEGALTYAAHADYYILLRACARAAQVDIRIMHIGVLSLEKRLSWLEDRIHHSLHLTHSSVTCEFCKVPDHASLHSIGLENFFFFLHEGLENLNI